MTKKTKNIVLMVLVCVVLVVLSVVITSVVTSQKFTTENVSDKIVQEDANLKILSVIENNESISVETTYGSFNYPRAFMDVISVDTDVASGDECLKFMAQIDGDSIDVYTIYYNSSKGVLCGYQVLPDDREVTVSVVFEDITENISDEWKTTFYAVQETFNDVIVSMAQDSRFIVAD